MFSIYAALDQRHRLPRLLQDRYLHFTQENQKSERLCGFLQVTEQSHVVSLRTSDSVSSTFFYPFPTLSYIPPLTPHPLMITFTSTGVASTLEWLATWHSVGLICPQAGPPL